MWFKNLCLYKLETAFPYDAEALEERLAADPFQPCGKLDQESAGFAPPLGDGHEQLVHAANGYLMVCLREESKLLPASVVKETMDERVGAIEAQEMRKVRKREKDRLKDEIILDLLPRAFSRSRRTYAYIDPRDGWIVVDAATWKKAEEVTEHLREVLGSLPIAPPQLDTAPQAVMTRWVSGKAMPSDFELGDECVLTDPQLEGAEVRCKRQDLHASEIAAHLKAGKRVSRVAVQWRERMSFVLDADMSVKRLRFNDVVQEDTADGEADSAAERFDSDFSIMTLELAGLIPRLMEVMQDTTAD
ncbi:recombination associated protein RdgC [Natronocella acetinitrilica]|uniref:Recombination-associated protein RdgC n=1 Tax=Natronocella acetinitrilica TaxID=414046 RepID=A0AAE3K9T0_9GAMM|nr:recombination-associated protein RdgC [Natronocella acetinitrilica]MCP1673055.1 recombination associated protein RdgC [Natronocella acetinitrilica]